jgi:dihydroorotate dehydrogenase (NAD+) catalytic subunit
MMIMDLSAKILGLSFDPAWINGSGTFTQPYRLKRILEYEMGGGVAKSTGSKPRAGNLEPTIAKVTEDTYINAMGLPSCGYRNLNEELREIYPLSKPLICSVYGNTEEEIVEVAKGLEERCDAIELNFSCPNIKPGEKTGVTIGRDPERIGSFTRAVKSNVRKPVIVKLTPSVYDIGEVARTAEEAGADAISAINTIPGGMLIDIYAKRPVLTAKHGGVSGRGIKSVAIGAIYNIYESVKIPIIGGGGITYPEDIIECVEAGSDVVSIATAFNDMKTEEVGYYLYCLKSSVENILDDIGASSLRELKGAAHG